MYMAPEIIKGNKYNGKVDVYSFGILMYDAVTNSVPYPLLLNGKMSPFTFNKKVVDDDYRPKFEYPIKKSIQKLIESCWASDSNERPTFEEIFKKLAYNIDDLVDNIYDDIVEEDTDNDDDDFNYYLEDVDVNEVVAYANDIDNVNQQNKEESEEKSISCIVEKLINPIIKENEEMKKIILKIQKENDEIIKKLDDSIKNANKNFNNVKKENEEMKNQIEIIQKEKEKLKKMIDPIKNENEEIK